MNVALPLGLPFALFTRTGGPGDDDDDEEEQTVVAKKTSCEACHAVACPGGRLCPECLIASRQPIIDPFGE